MFRNQSVSQHQFAMIPRADIPRASFRMQKTHKTTFDAAWLIPVYCEEVLPGDMFRTNMTAFARMATPIFPVMDNLHFECFWFFTPNRLVWDNWQRFMGERPSPGDSIDFNIPQMVSTVGGYATGTVYDYFGLPTTTGVVGSLAYTHSALPLRMYNLIYQEWFKDENLIDSPILNKDDGPDAITDYTLFRRGKRHDYFTSCLPFVQKGTAVPLFPTTTPIVSDGNTPLFTSTPIATTVDSPLRQLIGDTAFRTPAVPATTQNLIFGSQTGLMAQFTDVANTVNALRLAFATQKLLERDARGGTRYTEIVRSHFGVVSPDARLQRPEYLGGGSIAIVVNPVAQTSATSAEGSDTPQGNLSAIGTGLLRSGFTQSFTEHGYVMCIVNVRADLTYQQGLRRHWSRLTRYDFYFPAFAMLGEQSVLSKEIYCTGQPADEGVFGYQERWAEYRYQPSEITSLFRSTAAQSIDSWHFSEFFATRPMLNETFINDHSDDPVSRSIAVGEDAGGQQFICDMFFDTMATRPMPLYSVPGQIDRF